MTGRTKRQTDKRKVDVALTEGKPLPAVEDVIAKRARFEYAAEVQGPASSNLPGLAELLDCSSLKDQAAIDGRFNLIARSLLCDHVVVVKTAVDAPEIEYELLEVEFYLLSARHHEDPFTHGTEEQRISGRWYFHKAPRRSNAPAVPSSSKVKAETPAGGYRGGTRKGLDLTMGGPFLSPHFQQAASSQAAGPRGGVLFRSMRRLGASPVVISGPSLLVDEVLRVSGAATSILDFIQSKLGGDTNAFSSQSSRRNVQFYLRPRSKRLETSIYTSPRIGLDLSNPVTRASPSDPRVVFVQKPYRYFVHPTLLTANGRAQTFLGVFLSSSSSFRGERRRLLDEVARITGLKRTVVEKYADDFKLGKENGRLKDFVGAAGKGVCSKPASYLKMMGALAAGSE